MDTLLPILLIVAMAATVIVLFAGIVTFSFSSRLNAKYGNRLMAARVVLQGVAIAIFAAIVLLKIGP